LIKLNQRSNLLDGKGASARLLFSRKQIHICEEIGITDYFVGMEQSNEYALRKDVKFEWEEHRDSPIMSMIMAANRMLDMVEHRQKHSRLPQCQNPQNSGVNRRQGFVRKATEENGFKFQKLVRQATLIDDEFS